MKTFLEELMAKKDVTAYAVSKGTGIPMQSVYDWKHGFCKPSAQNIVKLSNYFGVPVSDFIEKL